MEQPDTREHVRHEQEFKLRFWRHGVADSFLGVSTNLSPGGIFIATTDSQPVGSRLVVRFLDEKVGFVAEAEVIHSEDSGMGIRFLTIDELVTGLLDGRPADGDA